MWTGRQGLWTWYKAWVWETVLRMEWVMKKKNEKKWTRAWS